MTFSFNVTNHSLSLTSQPALYSGNENYYHCTFDFKTADWDNLLKFAVFSFPENAVSVPIENNECVIPSEALSADTPVYIGVFGIDASEENYSRISTGLVCLFVGEGAYKDAAAPTTPAPDLWEKYYAEITKVGGFAQRAETAAENAESSATAAASDKAAAMQALSDLLAMLGTDIATLVGGKIPASQIPAIATTELYTAASLSEMEGLSVQNGDICIRSDENKSYIFNGGWIYLASPSDYAARSGYADAAGTAENAAMINNHRLVEMTAAEFEAAVKDEETYYLIY